MKLAIFGSGGQGCEICQIAIWSNEHKPQWDEILFADDGCEEGEFFGVRRMRFETAKALFSPDEIEFVIGVGEPSTRRKLFKMVEAAGYGFGSVIAHNATIYRTAQLGRSVVLQLGASAEQGTVVGDGVIVGNHAAVGHDSTVGDFVQISSKTNIGGNNTIGDETFFGLHAVTKPGLSIGSYVTVGMGSVVIRDVPDKVVVAGNPAKIIKERDENTKALGDSGSNRTKIAGGGAASH